MPVLSNQYQCKIALQPATSTKTRRSDKWKQNQLSKVFPFIIMCDYTYILILKGFVSSDHHLVVAFCIIILTVYTTGCNDKCFKNGEQQKLFEDRVNKKYMVLFPPGFRYNVHSFNLYIIDNYVNRTIGRCIPRI